VIRNSIWLLGLVYCRACKRRRSRVSAKSVYWFLQVSILSYWFEFEYYLCKEVVDITLGSTVVWKSPLIFCGCQGFGATGLLTNLSGFFAEHELD